MYILSRLSDHVAMNVIVKGGVFEFIWHIHMKNKIVFCEYRQDWFEFIVM